MSKPLLFFLLVTSQAFSQTDAEKLLQISASVLKSQGKDTAYWNHITKHSRFKFVKADTTVTGIVKKIFTERDGDLHVILKQRRKILRCEIICYQRVNEACEGFWNHTKRPKIGSRVMITGDYVYDRWHHWHEIHPVKKITSQ